MTISEYKVFIPSAGLGTRLGSETNNLNKALVSIDNKPSISHVTDKFPKDVEIVVAIGHRGDTLAEYFKHAYPDRKITTVEIANYQGPGSGLGRTLLDCEEHLQCPFIFCSNDTIVAGDIPEPNHDWIGYSELEESVTREERLQFRTISMFVGGKATHLHDKGMAWLASPYIGLAGINNYKKFWEEMREGVNWGSIDTGESYALTRLIEDTQVQAVKFEWYDTGNLANLEKARAAFKTTEGINVLPKSNEAIWFVNGRVIKYSADTDFIEKRVERAETLQGFVPNVVLATKNMYSYEMIRGSTVSSAYSEKVFDKLLERMSEFWIDIAVDSFEETCMAFYKDKTMKRIQQYFDRFEYKDQEETVNGNRLPRLMSLFNRVDWDELSKGIPVRFHGDFHFENILVSEDYSFVLLDWRQDFGGISNAGDIYYDLAKLLHGLIVSHQVVDDELFKISTDGDLVEFDIMRSHKLVMAEPKLKSYVESNNYSWKKVRILTALIYLNIAPLHHYPYSKFLFYFGKSMLWEELNENR